MMPFPLADPASAARFADKVNYRVRIFIILENIKLIYHS